MKKTNNNIFLKVITYIVGLFYVLSGEDKAPEVTWKDLLIVIFLIIIAIVTILFIFNYNA